MTNSNDIAKYLGISRGTVSRALNNSGRISEETQKKVLAAARELGYQPNKAARALVSNRVRRAAISLFSRPEAFWSIVKEGIWAAHENYRHFGFDLEIVENDLDNPAEQIQQIEKLVKSGVEAIAVAPNDPVLLDDTISKLYAKGFPIFTFNADIPSGNRLCYVGGHSFSEGRLAGELMSRLMGGQGAVGAFSFSDPVIPISQRVAGFNEYIARCPDIEVISLSRFQRNGANAYECACDFLRKYPFVGGIYVSFGVMEQVAQAVIDAGLAGKINMLGYDLSPKVEQLLRDGVIQYIIFQEPSTQGYYTAKLLYNLVVENQKPTAEVMHTKMEIITRENLYSYTDEVNRLSLLNLSNTL